MPRCPLVNEDDIAQLERHTFTDASEESFAAAVYLLVRYANGDVRYNLVKSATKLAPKKTILIPKLELQAALLGARLAGYICKSLTRPVTFKRVWTDSFCVRNWVRSTAAYYKPFVSHRIGEIQTRTEPDEWCFVPGSLNVIDAGTRSSLTPDYVIPEAWGVGPAFPERANVQVAEGSSLDCCARRTPTKQRSQDPPRHQQTSFRLEESNRLNYQT